MTAEYLIELLRDLGVRVAWVDGKPVMRFPEGMDGKAVIDDAGDDLKVTHRQAVLSALGEFDRCLVCQHQVRVPQGIEERQQLWSLCRATGGSILCPAFTPSHPGNSGWEEGARANFKPPKKRFVPQGGQP